MILKYCKLFYNKRISRISVATLLVVSLGIGLGLKLKPEWIWVGFVPYVPATPNPLA